MKISAYYPNYFIDAAISGAAYHILKGMQSSPNQIILMGIASVPSFKDSFYKNVLPSWAKSLVYKTIPHQTILKFSEEIYCRTLKQGDIAYLWPGIPLSIYQRLKNRGCKIIYEGVNTHEAYSKAILDDAYAKLNLPITHGITDEKVFIECSKLALVDFVFSCSPIMTESFLKNDVPMDKILQTSYGLGNAAIFDGVYSKSFLPDKMPTFIFVGSIGVRKGIHLLLDYWVKAKLKAKLQLVGNIEPAIKALVETFLKQDNIEHIAYTNDLASIYKNADVFVLPSLEEGSPLVTYMAFGAGLPVLVSPMGGGGIVEDGVQGIVIDPYDADLWIKQLQNLSTNASLRSNLALQARSKAPYYLWDAVAKRRLHTLKEALAKL